MTSVDEFQKVQNRTGYNKPPDNPPALALSSSRRYTCHNLWYARSVVVVLNRYYAHSY